MSGDSPFIGRNSIILCEAAMQKVLESYLNNLIIKGGVKVTSVKQVKNTEHDGFEIRIEPKDEPKA